MWSQDHLPVSQMLPVHPGSHRQVWLFMHAPRTHDGLHIAAIMYQNHCDLYCRVIRNIVFNLFHTDFLPIYLDSCSGLVIGSGHHWGKEGCTRLLCNKEKLQAYASLTLSGYRCTKPSICTILAMISRAFWCTLAYSWCSTCTTMQAGRMANGWISKKQEVLSGKG